MVPGCISNLMVVSVAQCFLLIVGSFDALFVIYDWKFGLCS